MGIRLITGRPRIGSIGVVVTLAVGGELKLSHFVTLRKLGLCVFGVTALGSCLGRWCEESHPWFHWESRKDFFFSFFTWVLQEGDLLAGSSSWFSLV